MRDIARRAHVNQSTVSRVLGGGGDGGSISEEVRRRIIRIAKRIDYQRNPSAVALRTGSTRTVLVVISDITDNYYSAIISGIEGVLVREGYSMILHSLVHGEPQKRLGELFHQYRLEGALLLGALPGLRSADLLWYCARGVPVIFLGRTVSGSGATSVTVDNEAGGRLVAEHFWALGHRRIAVMRGPRGWPDFPQRIAGFRKGILHGGGNPDDVSMFPCVSRQPKDGFEATKTLLASMKPTAIFALNDSTAIGCIGALAEAGLRVPEDVSVVGFDDSELAALAWPPLTTVRQPRFEMGQLGAERLLSSFRGDTSVKGNQVLGVTLVKRKSTCPPQ